MVRNMKNDTTTVQICVRVEAYEVLKEAAKKADKSVSVLVRDLLEKTFNLPKFESRRD
jgi:hypothetical protein